LSEEQHWVILTQIWDGPAPELIIQRALDQPGAKRRRMGIKFQCPQCRDDGHDRHRDNAIVFNDGKWACAYAPGEVSHKQAIAKALGALGEPAEIALDEKAFYDEVL